MPIVVKKVALATTVALVVLMSAVVGSMAVHAWRTEVEKICVVHKGQVQFVEDESVPAHLRHGDRYCAPPGQGDHPKFDAEKVCMIHQGHVIVVDDDAVRAHLKQGDTFCVPVPPDNGPPVPGDTGTPVPGDTGTPFPGDTGTPFPGDAGTPIPGDAGTPFPADGAAIIR
jgi:uncharacterized cupin superfamily protein